MMIRNAPAAVGSKATEGSLETEFGGLGALAERQSEFSIKNSLTKNHIARSGETHI